MTDIIGTIKSFMSEELDLDTGGLEPDTLLFSAGVIDSFSLVSLLTYVETTFGFRIGPLDVNLANFDSLSRMQAYIENSLRA